MILALILVVGFGLRVERVINPNADPGDDALAYTALAKSLYEDGSYGGPDFDNSSDWSPGAPLLYAGVYYATGGARDGAARLLQALLGTAAIFVVYLLGSRITAAPPACWPPPASAVYPPFIHSTGAVLSEPPAIFTLPAAILAFLWAADRRGTWEWAVARAAARGHGADPARVPGRRRSALVAVVLVLRWREGGLARAAAATAVLLVALRAADRALGRSATPSCSTRRADLDRRRQGALRRHLPARRRRVPAGQGGAGRALPGPHASSPTRRRSTASTPSRCSTASPRATRTCRATRRWARSAASSSPTTSATSRSTTRR